MSDSQLGQIRDVIAKYSRKSCSITGTGELEAVQAINDIAEIANTRALPQLRRVWMIAKHCQQSSKK